MRPLDVAGIAFCLVLLAIAVIYALGERHPLDLLFAAALAVFALTTIAMLAGFKHVLLAWFILAGCAASFGAIFLNIRRPRRGAPDAPSVNSPT